MFTHESINNNTLYSKRIIDVHTHVYLPRYVQLLRMRSQVPRIIKNNLNEERFIILPNEDTDSSTQSGRPIGREYYDISVKSAFMKQHGITTSVLRYFIGRS